MKVYVLTTLLAVCLLGFAANVNSKSIEIDSAEVDNIVNNDIASKSAEENNVEPDDADSDLKNDNDIEDHNEGDSSSKSAEEGIDLSDSTDAPESTEAPESAESTESTEAPEDPESTPAPESTEGPSDVPETTLGPDAQDPEVVDIEEKRTYVKDLMFMVEQMLSSAIDTLSVDAPEGQEHAAENIEEVHAYVKDLMTMLEQNMISVIDTASEPTVDNIEKVRKYVQDSIYMIEEKIISVIDSLNEPAAVPESREHPVESIERVHRYVKHLISTLEHKMISIIDIVFEPNVSEPKPMEPHHPHHNDHLPSHHGDSGNVSEGQGEVKPVPAESRTFSTLKWLLKSILKTLRGVNCTIKAVVNVKESTEQMLTNFQVCGVETTKQIQAVLDSAQQVLAISNDIISINANECGNADYLADVDASEKTSSKCAKQLSSKVRSLNKQISKTATLVKKVPTDAGDCVSTTFSNYQQDIVGFPDFVKTCAKL